MTNDYCLNLGNSPTSATKNAILADVSSYMSSRELYTLVPNIIIGLYSGSWCDRFKNARRYCLFACLFGQIAETLCVLLNAMFYELDFRFLLLTGIPAALAGNTIYTVTFSYLSAYADSENRALRFMIVDISMSLGER